MKVIRIIGTIILLYIIFVMVTNFLMIFGIVGGPKHNDAEGAGFLLAIAIIAIIAILLLNKGFWFAKNDFNEANNWTRESIRKMKRKGK